LRASAIAAAVSIALLMLACGASSTSSFQLHGFDGTSTVTDGVVVDGCGTAVAQMHEGGRVTGASGRPLGQITVDTIELASGERWNLATDAEGRMFARPDPDSHRRARPTPVTLGIAHDGAIVGIDRPLSAKGARRAGERRLALFVLLWQWLALSDGGDIEVLCP
jgi:hypothetical protein